MSLTAIKGVRIEPCRGCSAAIIWARTERNKSMPVDAKPVDNGNLVLVDRGVPPPLVRSATPDDPAQPRYVSHFATCPKAGFFRK